MHAMNVEGVTMYIYLTIGDRQYVMTDVSWDILIAYITVHLKHCTFRL